MRMGVLRWMLFFILILSLVTVLFWLYLNISATLHVQAQQTSIRLSDQLPTKISVGHHLQARAKGHLNTEIDVQQNLDLPLRGRYLAQLKFTVDVPVKVDIDYETVIHVSELMPVETTTDLIYKKKFLPKFPLKLDVPVKLDVPFQLKRQYELPIKIVFDGPVYLELNDTVHAPIRHHFRPSFDLDDPINMHNISSFNATMRNIERETKANLDMQMQLDLKNIRP